MKKVMMFAMFAILLAGFALASDNDSNSLNDSNGAADENNSVISANDDGEEDDENNSEDESGLLGASCGTVTPGENNECCISKGYSSWNAEKFKCIGQNETEEDCEAWKCTKWSACLNETATRKCVKTLQNCTTDSERPKLIRDCRVKEEFKFHEKLRDCPEACVCSGSTIKCTFENGTRVMTIYAGESGNVIVQIKNMNMSTNVTLYKNEEGKVYGTFKGNKTHEVKLPDEIKEKLQNHTRVKYYNESMNLSEEGDYHMNAQKKARLFWMIPVREKVVYSIDSETGEVISTKTVWWGFLARDVKEKNNSTTA